MREWRKNSLRDFLRRLLLLDESPRRTALAFSVGVFLGFSPFWGLHTALGLVAAFVFRLNRLAVLVGLWTNTPWTMAPFASLGTALGFWLMGGEARLPKIPTVSLLSTEFWQGSLAEFKFLVGPFFIGNMVLSVLAAAAAYFAIKWVLIQNAKRRLEKEG